MFFGCKNLKSIVLNSVASIDKNAFGNCDSLTEIYYKGTAEEWSKIAIADDNVKLYDATIYYYSETAPITDENTWYYGEHGEIIVRE